ncbi:MAG: hypothetical protein ACP5UO_02390 [Thermoplasmata archaeon]
MSMLIALSFTVFLIAILFLLLSLAMIARKYTLKGALISSFFLVISVEYAVLLYFLFQGMKVSLLLFASSDLLMLLLLIFLMITR